MNNEDKVKYIELKLKEIKESVEEKDKEIEELLHKSHSDDAIITKAIEYIVKETKNMPKNGCKQRLNELLKILKGSDKE